MSVPTRLAHLAVAGLLAAGSIVLTGPTASAIPDEDFPTVPDQSGCLEVVGTSATGRPIVSVPLGLSLITGTSGADVLVGTSGPDLIRGNGGDDVIHGLGGDDVLIGGEGDDTIEGNLGADCLEGNDGDDTLSGNAGADVLFGHQGTDSIQGNGGADTLFGYDVVNSEAYEGEVLPVNLLDGGDGDDTCMTGTYADFTVWVSCLQTWVRY